MYIPKGWNPPYSPDGEKSELWCDIGSRDLSIYLDGAYDMLEAVVKMLKESANNYGEIGGIGEYSPSHRIALSRIVDVLEGAIPDEPSA